MLNKEKISFVIPCYNSESTIKAVVAEIKETIDKTVYNYEIILVNDSSADSTWNAIQDLSRKDSKVYGILFAKNFGQHAALLAGYRQSSGDIIVSLDDDYQTPANEVLKLINKINEGYDVVYATYEHKKHSFFRNVGTKLNNRMCVSLLGKPKKLMITSYFAARRFVIDKTTDYLNPFPYVPGLILRASNNISSVSVEHRERLSGSSNYSFKKLLSLWINGFTAFSVKPLRISSGIGFVLSALSFIYLIFIVINKIVNPDVPMGWSSVVGVIAFVGGLLLMMLGMIGEYIGRIYISINNSPQYVIKETTNNNKSNE